MPYQKDGKRDYKRELAWEKRTTGKGRQNDRVQRDTARAEMQKAGKVHVGDGKDVGHKTAIGKGGTNAKSNLQVQSRASNTSFARNADGSMKSETSQRERRGRRR